MLPAISEASFQFISQLPSVNSAVTAWGRAARRGCVSRRSPSRWASPSTRRRRRLTPSGAGRRAAWRSPPV